MLAAMSVITIAYTFAADTPLLEPHNLIVDRSLPREQAAAQIIAARALRYFLEYRGRSSSACRPCADLHRQYAADRTLPGTCRTAGSLEANARRDPRPPL